MRRFHSILYGVGIAGVACGVAAAQDGTPSAASAP